MKRCFSLLIPPRYRPTFPLTEDGVKRAMEIVNGNNGRKSIYRTVYNFIDGDGEMIPIIDKVFVDFDPDGKGKGGIEDAKVFSAYLKERNIKHSNYYSGRGAHVYIYTHPTISTDFKNPSMAIRNFVNELVKKTGVTPDYHVVGDLSRVSRVPNTLNTKTGLFCVPLCEAMMQESPKTIESFAKKQRGENPFIDGDLVDLSKYDNMSSNSAFEMAPIEGKNDSDLPIENLPLCISTPLLKGDCGYIERFRIITYMRDLAYSQDDVIEILSRFLTPEKFEHCVFEEKQVEYLFKRQDILFPSCNTIKATGHCYEGCNGQKLYW